MSRPARIVYLAEFPTFLGGEAALCALIDGLDRSRFQPVVVGSSGGRFEDEVCRRGVEFAALPSGWRRGSGEQRAELLCGFALAQAPALIHANSLMLSALLGTQAPRLAVPIIGHARDIMRLSHARVAALNRLAVVFTASHATSAALAAQGVESARLRVAYDGIDTRNSWSPDTISPGALRRELGLSPDAVLAGMVGQLSVRKDPLTFLRAASLAAKAAPELHAVLIGERYADSAEARALERDCHAAAATLRGRAHFLGYRADTRELIRDLDILVNCSRQEPCGRTILEAMALARAVAATDVGGTRELLQHEVTGLLVPPGDELALAHALVRLARDRELRACLGKAARRVADERFSIVQTVCLVESAYIQILG